MQELKFSVSDFVAVFNQSLDMLYPQVAITGEIANFRVSKGKWVYFDLKDDYSSVKFFGSVFSLPGPLENGISVEVTGRPKLHNLYGFSVNYSSVRAVGEGSIKKAQMLLLQKLEKEGLFAIERKRTLPYPPSRVALVTSAESAAIADFRKIIGARWPALHVELFDSVVQGAAAPAALVAAIQAANALAAQPEVLIIIRGGGSADDLAAFSEESVVRAVAASRIPTLVAIGHENDVSLAELAADVRASTPSNAAELLVPDVLVERQQARAVHLQMQRLVTYKYQLVKELVALSRSELHARFLQKIATEKQAHQHSALLLRALNPKAPLQRGFALVRTVQGQPVRSVKKITKNTELSIEFKDGLATVKGV